MTSIGQHAVAEKWRLCAGVAIAAALPLAGCSSAASVRTPASPSTTSAPKPAGATSTSALGSGGSVATAVLSSWESAQQTLYGYLQAPWQQDRANLVAGQTAATLWPNLANYFVDPALKSEQTFLVGVKMGELNGPTSFDLGTPKVSALTGSMATVTGCVYDSGTTTSTGKPGPTSLGGGAGSYSGTWTVQLTGGSWKIASYRTATVSKC